MRLHKRCQMKVLIVETAFVACLLGFGIRAQAQGAPAEHSMTGVWRREMMPELSSSRIWRKGRKKLLLRRRQQTSLLTSAIRSKSLASQLLERIRLTR